MRRVVSILVACLPLPLVLVTGCPVEAPPPRAPQQGASPSVEAPPPAPPRSYTIADPEALPRGTAIAVDSGAFGVVIEGARVLVRGEDLRVAKDVTADALVAVDRVPAWLGGGFLFRTASALYASETFDGALRPITAIQESVARVSFGPKGALLRSSDGNRRMHDLVTGAPLPLAPLGLVDVLMLADGRAAALAEGGRALVSTDRGERWSDVTASLGAAPTGLVSRPNEIWIDTFAGPAFRVDPGGALREFDSFPPVVPEHLRARDPAWHGVESPLVAAVRRGARLDDGAVIVAAGGDVARVDPRTGAVKIVIAGRLPPDLPCEALRVGDDVLAVCALQRRPSVVVSHLASGHPTIERTFPVEGPFYAGDEGSLIFGGSCDGSRMRLAACVRDAAGVWHDHGVDPSLVTAADAGAKPVQALDAGADAGAGAPDPSAVVRWVVREGGRPLALVGGKNPGTFDPESGALRAWKKDEDAKSFPSDIVRALEPERGGGKVRAILDRRWSMSDGVLRGWLDSGQVVKIQASGEVARSAFVFPRAAAAGSFGFAINEQERSFQSIDHGETWTEVASPPVGRAIRFASPSRCSPLGCDLGAWLRLGWDASPPPVVPEPPPLVPRPPRPPRALLPELICVSAGQERSSKLPPTEDSPEDLGLGARRLPASNVQSEHPRTYRRRFYSRGAFMAQSTSWSGEDIRMPRAVLHGWTAEFEISPAAGAPQSGITIFGPGRGTDVFRRDFTFLEPFDADASVRATGFGLRDLEAATRSLGASMAQLFSPDGPEMDAIATITPLDPAGPSGLVFSIPSDGAQLLGSISGGASPRFKIAGARIDPYNLTPVSAVELGGGEIAVLLLGPGGTSEVLKLGAAGVSLLHRVPGFADTDLSPANTDALAIGAQGALAILRTPSGARPPSADDPALLLPLGSGPVVALAPWSTLTSADDPACRGDASGYRAVVHIVESWLRVRGSTRVGTTSTGTMLARVRWGASRVCLEAVEVADSVRTMRQSEELETSIVARFTGKSPAAARVGVMPGADLWQPVSCKIGAP